MRRRTTPSRVCCVKIDNDKKHSRSRSGSGSPFYGGSGMPCPARYCRSVQAIVKMVNAPQIVIARRPTADVAISGRHLQNVKGNDKNVSTDCVCSGAHCAAVGGFAALRMRRALRVVSAMEAGKL